MIEANELRIGNLITDHTGLNNYVKSIGVGWVKFIDDEAAAFDLCKPITLTEEWLIDKFNLIYQRWSDTQYEFYTPNGDFMVDFERINSVHLLQNWYFFTVGQELTA